MDSLLNKDCNEHNETDVIHLENYKINKNNKRHPQLVEGDSVDTRKKIKKGSYLAISDQVDQVDNNQLIHHDAQLLSNPKLLRCMLFSGIADQFVDYTLQTHFEEKLNRIRKHRYFAV